MNNWQTLDTAPRDGTRILFFYGVRKAVFTAWYENQYLKSKTGLQSTWNLESPIEDDFSVIFEEENPANYYWQPMMELPL